MTGPPPLRTQDPADFGRVGLVIGGVLMIVAGLTALLVDKSAEPS